MIPSAFLAIPSGSLMIPVIFYCINIYGAASTRVIRDFEGI